MFALHTALEASSAAILDLPLCQARLHLDARFPWIILVPRVAGANAIEDLTPPDQIRLWHEISAAGRAVRALGDAARRPVERLNVGILGNITSQLHAHSVGRRMDDAAWPGPVWGHGPARPYPARDLAAAIATASSSLAAE